MLSVNVPPFQVPFTTEPEVTTKSLGILIVPFLFAGFVTGPCQISYALRTLSARPFVISLTETTEPVPPASIESAKLAKASSTVVPATLSVALRVISEEVRAASV